MTQAKPTTRSVMLLHFHLNCSGYYLYCYLSLSQPVAVRIAICLILQYELSLQSDLLAVQHIEIIGIVIIIVVLCWDWLQRQNIITMCSSASNIVLVWFADAALNQLSLDRLLDL